MMSFPLRDKTHGMTIRFLSDVRQIGAFEASELYHDLPGDRKTAQGGCIETASGLIVQEISTDTRQMYPNLFHDTEDRADTAEKHVYYRGWLEPRRDIKVNDYRDFQLLITCLSGFYQYPAKRHMVQDDHSALLPFFSLMSIASLREVLVSPGDTARLTVDHQNVASDGAENDFVEFMKTQGGDRRPWMAISLYYELVQEIDEIARKDGSFLITNQLQR